MQVNQLLASLVEYGISRHLVEEADRTFVLNQLLDALSGSGPGTP